MEALFNIYDGAIFINPFIPNAPFLYPLEASISSPATERPSNLLIHRTFCHVQITFHQAKTKLTALLPPG